MPEFIEITSKDNPLIKFVSNLQSSSKHRKQEGLFVLEGLRICDDAYQNNIKFDKLIVTKDAFKKHNDFIKDFDGEIPGNSKIECGNYLEHDLDGARKEASVMAEVVRDWTPDMMNYKE